VAIGRVQPRPYLARGHEDRVVEVFGKFHHAVLLGKLPDILQDINDPESLHRGFPFQEQLV
jgi:hypothetical protein